MKKTDKPSAEVIRVVQALGVILSFDANRKMNRVKLMKLLWAADRYHIRRYGRTITGTDYMAMNHGPVNSLALDIAQISGYDALSTADFGFIEHYFTSSEKDTSMNLTPGIDRLSETDNEALQFAWDTFGHMKEFDLADKVSHRFPEWRRFEKEFRFNQSRRQPIVTEDFFKNPDDRQKDPFALDDSILEASKAMYLENKSFIQA